MDKFVKRAVEQAEKELGLVQTIHDAYKEVSELVLDKWAEAIGKDKANKVYSVAERNNIEEDLAGLFLMMFSAGYSWAKHEEE